MKVICNRSDECGVDNCEHSISHEHNERCDLLCFYCEISVECIEDEASTL